MLQLFFYYYLYKINKSPGFFQKKSMTEHEDLLPETWPVGKSSYGIYSEELDGLVIFHACKSCICKLLKVSALARSETTRQKSNKNCFAFNSQIIKRDRNCLHELLIELSEKNDSTFFPMCSNCKSLMCSLAIYDELNYLDESYIIT